MSDEEKKVVINIPVEIPGEWISMLGQVAAREGLTLEDWVKLRFSTITGIILEALGNAVAGRN